MVQHNHPRRIELTLLLTPETTAIMDLYLDYELADPDGDRASVALGWLTRWSRRADKALDHADRYGPGTQPLTVPVPDAVWHALDAVKGDEYASADELASAVVNDAGNEASWKKTYGKLK